jgi:hypothetical protein
LQVKTGKLGGTVEVAGRDKELQAPGLSRHGFAGRESTRKTFIEVFGGCVSASGGREGGDKSRR